MWRKITRWERPIGWSRVQGISNDAKGVKTLFLRNGEKKERERNENPFSPQIKQIAIRGNEKAHPVLSKGLALPRTGH